MKRILILTYFCLAQTILSAQNIAAYNDYRNYLIAFDNGVKQELEYNSVKSFKVGGTMVAWVDFLENFKVFYKGKTQILEKVPIGNFQASDYLIAYTLGIGSELYVVDAGKLRLLTTLAKYYTVSDSIISFYDMQTQSYRAYYKGKIIELDYTEENPKKDEMVSDNIIAFISRTGELRVFYHGEIFPLLLMNGPITYQAGKDIVPYIDGYTSSFKAFYKGNTYELEQNIPLSFKTGDDLVAFESQDWNLNVFYDGKITKLSTSHPKFYSVSDSLVVYEEYNEFKIFYKGKIHTLETNFIPKNYQSDFSTLVYLDQQNRLTAFYNGEKKIITYETVSNFELYGNTIHYSVMNSDFIFWKGKNY